VANVPTECVIGVDLGGTNLKAALLAGDGALRCETRRVIAGLRTAELLDALADTVCELRERAREPVAAAGFGIACLIDERSGLAASSTHLPIVGVPFAAAMEERLAVPVRVDNDANMALLAELRAGAAADARVAVMLTLGTGVGGAIALDGEIFRGARGAGGELGHIVLDRDGPPCGPGCPGRGCLESFVSGSALARAAAAAGVPAPAGRALDGALVSELARGGEEVALALLRSLGEWLGLGIVSLINVFDPDVVVVGGGVCEAGELFLEPARAVVAERAGAFAGAHVVIRQARFGARAGMLGAALAAREALAGRVAA
jgi:glucokinase